MPLATQWKFMTIIIINKLFWGWFFSCVQVFDAQFNPAEVNSIVSCGVKHIKFWKYSGNTLTAKKGVFGKVGEIQTILCLTFALPDVTYSGTMSGDVYIWKGTNLSSVIHAVHIVRRAKHWIF